MDCTATAPPDKVSGDLCFWSKRVLGCIFTGTCARWISSISTRLPVPKLVSLKPVLVKSVSLCSNAW